MVAGQSRYSKLRLPRAKRCSGDAGASVVVGVVVAVAVVVVVVGGGAVVVGPCASDDSASRDDITHANAGQGCRSPNRVRRS